MALTPQWFEDARASLLNILGADSGGVGGVDPGGIGGVDSGGIGGGIQNPIKYDDLIGFINALIEIIIQIGTPILVLAIVYVGFLFVQASGKPEKLNEAKQALVWTLIGAAIVLGAFVISAAIQATVSGLAA